MYLSHFGLSEKPFSISPDPQFLWLSDTHAGAFETLKDGILERDGCVLLTGDVGTGKTTLIQRLVQLDHVAAVFVTISDPDLRALDFCNILADEFGMGRRFDTRDDFLAALKPFLLQAFSTYRKVLVIIDEAQRLNAEALAEAAALSDLHLDGRKLLKFFFVGQLEFSRLLQQGENAPVQERISAQYCLMPLTEEDTQSYIEHRLKVAGREEPLFTREAVSEVQRLSKGYPRLINIVCDHALLFGYGDGLDRIDAETVRNCSRNLAVALDIEELPDKRELVAAAESAIAAKSSPITVKTNRLTLVAGSAALLAAAAVFLFYRFYH
jgi:general secretion pathway protein A